MTALAAATVASAVATAAAQGGARSARGCARVVGLDLRTGSRPGLPGRRSDRICTPVTAHFGDVQPDVRTSDPALGTLQRFTGPHRGDHVVDRLGFRAGVVWVVHEGTVGRPRYDAMKAVG